MSKPLTVEQVRAVRDDARGDQSLIDACNVCIWNADRTGHITANLESVARVRSVVEARWRRIEPGLWHAADYELRRRTSGGWRIIRSGHGWSEASTLTVAKQICVEDYGHSA